MSELERFKREINLAAYAQAHGYEIDRKRSGKRCLVMRSERRKIVVGEEDGYGAHFAIGDSEDGGLIIDFVKSEFNKGLGEARKVMREWLRIVLPSVQNPIPRPVPTTKDRCAWQRSGWT